MRSLRHLIDTNARLMALLSELDQLHEQVRKATPSIRRSRQRPQRERSRLPMADTLRTNDHQPGGTGTDLI
jgi:hypothetical protein